MEKKENKTIYDLAIIGNGIAAQTFLWSLSKKERFQDRKSQNFSIAHIYSEKLCPPCSYSSSATVSINGISEDVSELGNQMRDSYFLFNEIYEKENPSGVEKVKRIVVGTNDEELKKLKRRYGKLEEIQSSLTDKKYLGASYDSFLVSTKVFLDWLEKRNKVERTIFESFAKNISKEDDVYKITLEGEEVWAKKILLCTGAYSKIYAHFFDLLNYQEKVIDKEGNESEIGHVFESKNTIKAGSFLEKDIDLQCPSIYLSIDGHLLLYRNNAFEKKLIIGNSTTVGAFEAPNYADLKSIFDLFKEKSKVDIGNISDFKIRTGLRHKGPKRLMIARKINPEHEIYQINGLYKNGFTMSFLAAEKMVEALIDK